MKYKSNKAFTLLEVLITVAILSTAIVFVFRSFTTSLSSTKFSQNITLACYLAEGKLWEIEEKQKQKTEPLIESNQDSVEMQGRTFNWQYETTLKEPDLNIIKVNLVLSWQENTRKELYTMEFLSYLLPKKQ